MSIDPIKEPDANCNYQNPLFIESNLDLCLVSLRCASAKPSAHTAYQSQCARLLATPRGVAVRLLLLHGLVASVCFNNFVATFSNLLSGKSKQACPAVHVVTIATPGDEDPRMFSCSPHSPVSPHIPPE